MGLIERQAIDRAFRAGLLGEFARAQSRELAEGDERIGPGLLAIMATRRMPGLTSAEDAKATGKALRLIAQLFDEAGAPARVVEQFRDNLAAAIMGEQMRLGGSWSQDDTIEMFLDMYERILEPDTPELERVKIYIAEHVKNEKPPARKKRGLSGWFAGKNAA